MIEETTEDTTEEIQEETVEETETQVEDEQEENSEETVEEEETEEKEEKEEETKEEEDLHEYKVYGETRKANLEQLKRLASMAEGANQKFEETKHAQEKMAALYEGLKTDPFETLQKLGVDATKKAEEHLLKLYNLEQMTPEQKKQYELEQENKQLKAEKENQLKEVQTKEQQVLVEKFKEEYDQEFTAALEKSDIPKNPQSVARMARYMEEALNEGFELPAEKAALLVKEDIQNELIEISNKADPEKLIKMFPEEAIKKLKQYDLSKIKSPMDKNTVGEKTNGKLVQRKSTKKTFKEMQEELNSAFGGDPWVDT